MERGGKPLTGGTPPFEPPALILGTEGVQLCNRLYFVSSNKDFHFDAKLFLTTRQGELEMRGKA